MIIYQVCYTDGDVSTHPTKKEALTEAKKTAERGDQWARGSEVYKAPLRDDLTPRELICAALGREAYAKEYILIKEYEVKNGNR